MADETPPTIDPTGGYRNAPTSAPPSPGAPGTQGPSEGTVFTDPIVVDTEALTSAAAMFHAAAQAANAQIQAAHAQTENSEEGATPWGSDPLGAAFGESYVPVQQAMDQGLAALVALLDDIGDRLTTAAGVYTGAEDDAVDIATSFNSSVTPSLAPSGQS